MSEKNINNVGGISPQVSEELRRLMHDLSNALEIILQSGYLLTTAELQDPAKGWLGMLDGGAQQALAIHRELRDYIRAHSD